jgi:hypothetical protein
MKSLILILGSLSLSSPAFASRFECAVSDGNTTSTLILDGDEGRVIDSVDLPEAKTRITVEMYFLNIQIHYISLEDGSVISTSTAPEKNLPSLTSSFRNVAEVDCRRK